MTEESDVADQDRDVRLPSALRAPLSRNVQLLLQSRIPARLAWNDLAGRPRVAPMWFRWTGSAFELSAFVGSRKLEELHDGDLVAITIDTENFPYRSLRVRGPLTLDHVQGLTSSYRQAAVRYLGDDPARDWCQRLAGADQVLLTVHPVEASASQMWDAGYLREPIGER